MAICGFILGLIVTWFTFSFLPFKNYTEPLLIDNVIGAIGFSLYRIMVPGMVAMLIAARSGAAIAADIDQVLVLGQKVLVLDEGCRSLHGNAATEEADKAAACTACSRIKREKTRDRLEDVVVDQRPVVDLRTNR